MNSPQDKYKIDPMVTFMMIISFFIVLIDISFECYPLFRRYLIMMSDRPFIIQYFNNGLIQISNYPIFEDYFPRKVLAIFIMTVTAFGVKAKKAPMTQGQIVGAAIALVVSLLSFLFCFVFSENGWYWTYIGVNLLSFILYFIFLFIVRRAENFSHREDLFNEENERFIQEKNKLENEYSVNIKTDKGWVNVVNPFRATIVMGTPGSGKSYSVIEEYIRQHIRKEFTMLVYDFKFPALAKETYGFYRYYQEQYGKKYKIKYGITTFDEPEYSDFINPISADKINSISDAIEASQTVLYNINKEWIKQ